MVDAVDDGQVDILTRRGNQHLLGARVDMLLAAVAVGEEAGAFENQFDAVGGVRQVCRILFLGDVDALAVDEDAAAVGLHVARKFAMNAVMLEQPGVGLGVGEVVDADEIEPAIGPLQDRSGDQAADAAESVDGDFGHWIPRCFIKSVMRVTILSGVRPK